MKKKEAYKIIVSIVLQHYPDSQAIYLFGSYMTLHEWPCSDVDIAILLPRDQAHRERQLMLTPYHSALAEALEKAVDLLNARMVETVFQKEIIQTARLLYCSDHNARLDFEALTLSLYQKLNDERKEIVEAFEKSGRAYSV